MQIPTFEKRLQPGRTAGIPDPCFFFGFAAIVVITFSALMPVIILKIPMFLGGVALLYQVSIYWKNYDDWYLSKSKDVGKQQSKMKTFSPTNKILSDVYCWKTSLNDSIIINHDGSVSLAFTWNGVENRYFDYQQHKSEFKQRVALLNIASQYPGICIEHHFVRNHDSSLADVYLDNHHKFNPDAPEFIKDIRQQLVDLYRPLARSNKVMTVLSFSDDNTSDFLSTLLNIIKPSLGKKISKWSILSSKLLDISSELKSKYSGFNILSADEYALKIQSINKPYQTPFPIDWRFDLSEQLVTDKPIENDGCLFMDDTYFKTILIQNYPEMDLTWFFYFCYTKDVDLHISQIIIPKSSDKALDKSQKKSAYQTNTISEKKGTDRAIKRIQDSQQYQAYITEKDLPVADNAYIVSFYSKDVNLVKEFATTFKNIIANNSGKARDDIDIQMDMFKTRLPGMGRFTHFRREDHGEVIAAMMPFTTATHGNKLPECLRITYEGHLVGFSPSKLSVPHEAVISETDGGKDTQYGLKFLETYDRIRYDFIELGNSYQAAIQSVGGRYCRAKEQSINPLSPYAELAKAKNIGDTKDNIYASMLSSMSDVLLPVFKGFTDDAKYSRPEEVVMGRALSWCYNNPIENQEAPTLPDLLKSFDQVEVEKDRYKEALISLKDDLEDFLNMPSGECFRNKDQFIISPIANAIDFLGLEGDLFNFTITFIIMRLANSAMARGQRSQIVLNEYKVLLETAPHAIRHITWMIDRMGRKDWVGLTRISQDIDEIQIVDKGAINSIRNVTLLSRNDKHQKIGEAFRMPSIAIPEWTEFAKPDSVDGGLDYREGFVCENNRWHRLYLKFPQILLDIMNTRGKDKPHREKAYKCTSTPYEYIAKVKQLIQEAKENENTETNSTDNSTPLL